MSCIDHGHVERHCDGCFDYLIDRAGHIAALEAENRDLREQRDNACKLVADMHAAAVGEIRGPIRGVVEDVSDLRAKLEAAERELRAVNANWAASMDLERELRAKLEAAEQLRETIANVVVIYAKERDEANAENARLREAQEDQAKANGLLFRLMTAYGRCSSIDEIDDVVEAVAEEAADLPVVRRFEIETGPLDPSHSTALVPAQEREARLRAQGFEANPPNPVHEFAHGRAPVQEPAKRFVNGAQVMREYVPGYPAQEPSAPVLPVDQRPKALAVFGKRRYWMCSFSGVIADDTILLDRKCPEHDHVSAVTAPDGGKRFPEEG